MGRFLPYQPDQAYLVPPSVKDELGEDHLCFFIHQTVEHMDLKSFEQEYGEEGGVLYCPALMLKVWLYAYAVGITSGRRLEQRIREDLGLRYLAGAECVSATACAGIERRVHASTGDGAGNEAGTFGSGGDRLDADSGGGVAQPTGDGRAAAAGAGSVAAEHSEVAEAV
jgi:hypothetical protein